jgi:prevent-host-death family protein
MKNNIVGLKELRENTEEYIRRVKRGESFLLVRRSKPIFKIVPPDREDIWEEVVDFTKIKKGGVEISQILSRL